MKIFSILSILLASFTSTAFAADKAGDSCPTTGYASTQIGGELLSCIDGKWELLGHVGTTNVTLAVRVMEGKTLLTSASVTTLDGQPAPIGVGNLRTYVAESRKDGDKVIVTTGTVKEGLFMTMTPTLIKKGKIKVDFVMSKVEVTAMSNVKQGDLTVQLPQIKSIDLKQALALDDGQEFVIPFGSLVNSTNDTAESGKLPHPQYTLRITATKI